MAANQLVPRSLSAPRGMVHMPPYSELAVGTPVGARDRFGEAQKIGPRDFPLLFVTATGPVCQPMGRVTETVWSISADQVCIPGAPGVAITAPVPAICSGSPARLRPISTTVSPATPLSGL